MILFGGKQYDSALQDELLAKLEEILSAGEE